MIKTRDEKTILAEEIQKYRHYHQEKLINMNDLQVKTYYFLIRIKYGRKG